MIVRAKLSKRSGCPCGAPAVNDQVTMGTEYFADTENVCTIRALCGVCGADITQKWIAVTGGATGTTGFLPLALFEFDEGPQP